MRRFLSFFGRRVLLMSRVLTGTLRERWCRDAAGTAARVFLRLSGVSQENPEAFQLFEDCNLRLRQSDHAP